MRYQISGKQIDVGDALSTHVKTQLGETIDKYSQRPTDATVIFSRNAHEFICDAVVHLSTGLNVQAKGASTEIYAAFEQCKERMDKQLRRYKRRLKDHHKERAPDRWDRLSSPPRTPMSSPATRRVGPPRPRTACSP